MLRLRFVACIILFVIQFCTSDQLNNLSTDIMDDVHIMALDIARVSENINIPTVDLKVCIHRNFPLCRNVGKRIFWKPAPKKYLFVFCAMGQISNRVVCLEKYMILAAILQRVLIVPEIGQRKYNYSAILDIEQIDFCLGTGRVIWLKEYLRLENKSSIDVDFTWWSSSFTGCEERFKGYLSGLSVTISKNRTCKQGSLDAALEKAKFLKWYGEINASVLCLGDVFFNSFTGDNGLDIPVSKAFKMRKRCGLVLRPNKQLIISAEKYRQQYLGSNYVGVHLRRGDFYAQCLKIHGRYCFPSIAQVAVSLAGSIKKFGSVDDVTIFLATNGGHDEISFLKSTLSAMCKSEMIRINIEGGDDMKRFMETEFITDQTSKLTFLKVVMAKARMFYAYFGSSFSHDILMLRSGWNMLTSDDGFFTRFKQFNGPNYDTVT